MLEKKFLGRFLFLFYLDENRELTCKSCFLKDHSLNNTYKYIHIQIKCIVYEGTTKTLDNIKNSFPIVFKL